MNDSNVTELQNSTLNTIEGTSSNPNLMTTIYTVTLDVIYWTFVGVGIFLQVLVLCYLIMECFGVMKKDKHAIVTTVYSHAGKRIRKRTMKNAQKTQKKQRTAPAVEIHKNDTKFLGYVNEVMSGVRPGCEGQDTFFAKTAHNSEGTKSKFILGPTIIACEAQTTLDLYRASGLNFPVESYI